jgi:hypothetical protein
VHEEQQPVAPSTIKLPARDASAASEAVREVEVTAANIAHEKQHEEQRREEESLVAAGTSSCLL